MGGDAVCVSGSHCLRVGGAWLKPRSETKKGAVERTGGAVKVLFEIVKTRKFSSPAAGQKASTFSHIGSNKSNYQGPKVLGFLTNL